MSKRYTAAQKKAIAQRMREKEEAQRMAVAMVNSRVAGHGAYRAKRRARPRRQVKGNGDYKSTIGYQVGSNLGGLIGYGAQKLIKHVTGFGDYQITHNSLMGGLYNPPELANLRDRGTVIRHREYMTDITASSAFTVNTFAINPGLFSTFPWLSQVAEAFEEYYITGMIFEYKTLSADYTTASSAALGYVVMATQYNVLNPPFADKKTMENYEFSNSAKPSETFIHPIECKRSITPVSELYVRTGAVPGSADPRLYDLGSFQIATGGNSGSGILGELWVTFEIVLCKPKLLSSAGLAMQTDHWQLSVTTTDAAHPLGTDSVLVSGSSIGTTIDRTGTILTFPATINSGQFMLVYTVVGTSGASLVGPVVVTTAGCSVLSYWYNDVASSVNNSSSTAIEYIHCFIITIIGPSAVLTWGTAGTLPVGVDAGDLWIAQINSGILT